jgi:uncharacterized SAM-binding protein YcdF (DUF218 family)
MSGKGGDMVPIWLVLGVLCVILSLKKCFAFVFSYTWTKAVLSIGVLIFIIAEGIIIASGCWAAPEKASDFIIVLGASVEGAVPSRTLEYRLETACQYLMTFKEAKAVLSGGQGNNEDISEAEAMYRYLVSRGIDSERLILEDRSTNTYENLQYTFALLGNNKNLKLCIVTSGFHMLRAKLIASELGMQVSGFGAKSYMPLIPNYYVRELLAVIKELIT